MARLEMLENDIGIMQEGETYLFDAKFREEGTAVALTTGTMLITYPCDTGSQSTSLVTASTTGRYEGTWNIPSSATYGEYIVSITAIYEGNTYKFENSFYILPWNIAQQVRSVTGIKQSNDIDDRDIAIIAWNAYLEAREKVFLTKLWEKFKVDSAHLINGSNKAFYAYENNLVDDHLACDEVAIQGYYEDTNHDQHSLTVTITTSTTGLLSVADKDGNALTSNTSCDYWLIYRIKSPAYREELFKKAVVYLTAHEIILRFNELDKATLSDLGSNKPIILANPDRMLKKYKETIKKISIPRVDGI
jgi:hypothetical protein